MNISSLTQRILISLAVITTFGVLVHDTKIDQATALALTIPLGLGITLAAVPTLHSEGHTHIERGSYGKTTVMGMPRIQSRNDYKKYLLPKSVSRSNNYFGDSQILWPNF